MSAEWPLMKSGSKGAGTKAVQRLLAHRGAELAADGAFGPETEGAVKAFQTAQKLAADGAVGAETWPALVVQVANGARGEAVTAAQELLSAEVAGVAVDGVFGPATEKGTRDFQEKVGLNVDGIVGPHTWQVLVVQNET